MEEEDKNYESYDNIVAASADESGHGVGILSGTKSRDDLSPEGHSISETTFSPRSRFSGHYRVH